MTKKPDQEESYVDWIMQSVVDSAKDAGKEIVDMLVEGAMGKLTGDSRQFLRSMGLVGTQPEVARDDPPKKATRPVTEPAATPRPDADHTIAMKQDSDGVWR